MTLQNKGNGGGGLKKASLPLPLKEVNSTFTNDLRHNGCTSFLADTGHACKFKAQSVPFKRRNKDRLKNLSLISGTNENPLITGNAFFWGWYQKQKPLAELASLKVVFCNIRLYNASTWSDCSPNVKNIINIQNG